MAPRMATAAVLSRLPAAAAAAAAERRRRVAEFCCRRPGSACSSGRPGTRPTPLAQQRSPAVIGNGTHIGITIRMCKTNKTLPSKFVGGKCKLRRQNIAIEVAKRIEYSSRIVDAKLSQLPPKTGNFCFLNRSIRQDVN